MTTEELQNLKQLLISDKLEIVIRALCMKMPQNEDVISISGRLNDLRNEKAKGTLTYEEAQRTRNQIREATLSIINGYSERNDLEHKISNDSGPFSILIAIACLMFFAFMVYMVSQCPFPNYSEPYRGSPPPVSNNTHEEKHSPITTKIPLPFFEEKNVSCESK